MNQLTFDELKAIKSAAQILSYKAGTMAEYNKRVNTKKTVKYLEKILNRHAQAS